MGGKIIIILYSKGGRTVHSRSLGITSHSHYCDPLGESQTLAVKNLFPPITVGGGVRAEADQSWTKRERPVERSADRNGRVS